MPVDKIYGLSDLKSICDAVVDHGFIVSRAVEIDAIIMDGITNATQEIEERLVFLKRQSFKKKRIYTLEFSGTTRTSRWINGLDYQS